MRMRIERVDEHHVKLMPNDTDVGVQFQASTIYVDYNDGIVRPEDEEVLFEMDGTVEMHNGPDYVNFITDNTEGEIRVLDRQ